MIFGKNDTVKNLTNAGKLHKINADKSLLQTLQLAPMKWQGAPLEGGGGGGAGALPYLAYAGMCH